MQPFTSPVGRYAFGAITSLQENKQGKKEWLAALVIGVPESKVIFDAMDGETKARQENKQWPMDPPKDALMPFKPSMKRLEDGSRVAEEGMLLWVFRRKEIITVRGEQKLQSAPQIWDGGGLNITKNCPEIGYGSELKAFFQPYAYSNMTTGVQLQLVGIQIVTLKERVDNFAPDAIEGAYRAPEDQQPGKSLAEMFEGEAFESDPFPN